MSENPWWQIRLQTPSESRKSAFPSRRQAVLVLGMHRSGTSAFSGVVNALGVAGPKTLASSDEFNQRGYFESPRIFTAHDEMLASIGSSWDDWRQLDPRWLQSKSESHRQALKALFIDEFGDEQLIYVKDPRICRFVPFVCTILAELNFSTIAVLLLRNPLEVAYSLQRRDNFELPKSTMLWLRHVLDAEYFSRNLPRYFLAYEELLQNWRYHVDRIAEKTGIVWPDRSDRSGAEIDQFLTTELYHERAKWDETKDHRDVFETACHTYRILMDICTRGESKELLEQLDSARKEVGKICHIFAAPTAAEDIAQGR
jgi:hypothetical protein